MSRLQNISWNHSCHSWHHKLSLSCPLCPPVDICTAFTMELCCRNQIMLSELNKFSWFLQWFPRARLPEPGTGGGGGAGSPVWAGGVPASPRLSRQHLHHHCHLILLLSPDARHLPGLLLYPELWEFLWLPFTRATGSHGSPSLPQDGRWRDGSHDRGDQNGQQSRCQFPRGVWRSAAAARPGQGDGFYYHRMIQVLYLLIMSYFAVMSYGNICRSAMMADRDDWTCVHVETSSCEAIKTPWWKLPEDFSCLSFAFHMQIRCTYLS